MVLEHLFPENWLEYKSGYAFLLGAVYSVIGITLARLLFGGNSGLASVVFVSLLLIPSLKKLCYREENKQEKEKSFSLKRLFIDNEHLVRAFIGIFFGVFTTYYLLSSIGMQHLGWDVSSVFREQVFLDPVISGRASYSMATFWDILSNNWWVLLACFLLSLISGNGATFFIVWNASAWGVIFGVRSVAAAAVLGEPTIQVGAIMLLIIVPHVILEGGAYILAGIAGAILSEGVIDKAASLKRFLGLFAGLIALFWIANTLLNLFGKSPITLILKMLIVLGLVSLLRHSFVDKKHKEMFVYNYWLFIIALAVFIIGALLETGVLSWVGILGKYYGAAMLFA